jgi:competence protein ComEA
MKKSVNRVLAACMAAVFAIVMGSGLAFAASKPAPSQKININTATVQQLTLLPGVGEKLATRIVDYRQKSGGYKSAQELLNVRGIGEKNFQKLQPLVTVSAAAPSKAPSH